MLQSHTLASVGSLQAFAVGMSMLIKCDPPLLSVVLSLQLPYLPFILLLKSNLRATRTFQASFLVLSDASYMKLVEELPGTLYALFGLVWFVYTCALKWKQLKVFSVGNRVIRY